MPRSIGLNSEASEGTIPLARLGTPLPQKPTPTCAPPPGNGAGPLSRWTCWWPLMLSPPASPSSRATAASASLRPCLRLADRSKPLLFFFFHDTATTEIYTLSLHDALPISRAAQGGARVPRRRAQRARRHGRPRLRRDRKSTRLNSSHVESSYAVFCLKKKKKLDINARQQLKSNTQQQTS